jgi:hypothetical protein
MRYASFSSSPGRRQHGKIRTEPITERPMNTEELQDLPSQRTKDLLLDRRLTVSKPASIRL